MSKKKKKYDYDKDTWTTLKGEVIPVKDMTTMHIMNSIKFLENEGCPEEKFEFLREELNIRLGIALVDEGPVKNRWDILDLKKDDDDIGDNIW